MPYHILFYHMVDWSMISQHFSYPVSYHRTSGIRSQQLQSNPLIAIFPLICFLLLSHHRHHNHDSKCLYWCVCVYGVFVCVHDYGRERNIDREIESEKKKEIERERDRDRETERERQREREREREKDRERQRERRRDREKESERERRRQREREREREGEMKKYIL